MVKTLSIPKLEELRLALELFTVLKNKKVSINNIFCLKTTDFEKKRQSQLDTSAKFIFNGTCIVEFLKKNVLLYLSVSYLMWYLDTFYTVTLEIDSSSAKRFLTLVTKIGVHK